MTGMDARYARSRATPGGDGGGGLDEQGRRQRRRSRQFRQVEGWFESSSEQCEPGDPMLTERINSDPGEWCGDHEDMRRRARDALRQSITREWRAEDSADHDHPVWAVAVVWGWLELTCVRRRVAAWVRWPVRPRVRARHAWSWLRDALIVVVAFSVGGGDEATLPGVILPVVQVIRC